MSIVRLSSFYLGILVFAFAKIAAGVPDDSVRVSSDPIKGSDNAATSTLHALSPIHNNGTLAAYRVESDIELEVESGPLNGSCSVSVLGTDSLMMTFQGPFGILLGKLSANPVSMQYFDALRTEVLEGDPRSEALTGRMPIPLHYNDIVHLMRCEVPYGSSDYILAKKQGADTTLIYSYSVDDRFVDFAKISARDGSLLAYQRKARNGDILMNISYSEYRATSGVTFPRKITMSFPARNTVARFSVTDLVINPRGERYSFSVPKGVKRTTIE